MLEIGKTHRVTRSKNFIDEYIDGLPNLYYETNVDGITGKTLTIYPLEDRPSTSLITKSYS